MKTPMQLFKEILLRQRDYNLGILQEYSSDSESCDARIFFEAYQARLFLCDDMLDRIDIFLMQEEKDCIIATYEFGWDAGAINQRPVSSNTHQEGEDFYNKTFNQ